MRKPYCLSQLKPIVCILILLCGISTLMYANKRADSLLIEFKKHPDNLALKLEAGIAYLKSGNIDTAEILFNETAAEAVKKNNVSIFIRAKTNIGSIYADKGENVRALSNYQQALNKAEAINDKKVRAGILKNIGALYISWKKFDQALSYYEQAEKIATEINEEELVADCQNNKGTVYEQLTQYDKALAAYKNALDLYTRKNIQDKISMALSNIAIVYKYQKNYAASLAYNQKALALSVKMDDKWIMAATYNNIGNLYGEMGDYPKAISYCEQSIAIAKKINAIEIVESAYDSMSDAAAKAGDYKSAFNYHKQFSATNAQFINIENTRQLSELSVKFETEQKQKLIQQQQFEISKRNYWLFGSFALLLLVAAVGFLIFRNNRYRQEKRLQTEIHKQQEIATRSLFEGEQKERIRLARDLHDSIGQMLSVVKMNVSNLNYQYQNNTSIAGTLELVDKTIAEVRNISHNLIPEELNFGLFTALENMCDKINTNGATRVDMDVPDDMREYQFEKTNELSIYRIVQEVLNNMIKHSQASHIAINALRNANSLTIAIRDNGKGFDTSKINELKGLGWKNIAARINMLDGQLQVRSEQLTGTQIEITIPG